MGPYKHPPGLKHNKVLNTVGGFILAGIGAYLIAAALYTAQGFRLSNFNYGLSHKITSFYLYAQLGLAANIGIFFLMMRKEHIFYFSRGFMLCTLFIALWIFYVEIV